LTEQTLIEHPLWPDDNDDAMLGCQLGTGSCTGIYPESFQEGAGFGGFLLILGVSLCIFRLSY